MELQSGDTTNRLLAIYLVFIPTPIVVYIRMCESRYTFACCLCANIQKERDDWGALPRLNAQRERHRLPLLTPPFCMYETFPLLTACMPFSRIEFVDFSIFFFFYDKERDESI